MRHSYGTINSNERKDIAFLLKPGLSRRISIAAAFPLTYYRPSSQTGRQSKAGSRYRFIRWLLLYTVRPVPDPGWDTEIAV